MKKSKSQAKKALKLEWFVMRGHKVDAKDEVGFLSISKDDPKNVYKIVEDVDDASFFPSTNVYKTKGFGTPQQWLKFFKGEDSLSAWKFHLVKIEKK